MSARLHQVDVFQTLLHTDQGRGSPVSEAATFSTDPLVACAPEADARPPKPTEPHKHWLLWQMADSAFPAGGFAHSGGLEAAVQQGELRELHELHCFIEASLCQAARATLPFMTAAYLHPGSLSALDHRCDCFIRNHVANRASRLQGQALLASAERIFQTPALRRMKEADAGQLPFGHFPPVFGVVLHELGITFEDAARLFLFNHLRGLISAAVRLGLTGPLQGQTLQQRLSIEADNMLLRCQNLSVDSAAQTAPLLDLWQSNQDRLYSRLFQS